VCVCVCIKIRNSEEIRLWPRGTLVTAHAKVDVSMAGGRVLTSTSVYFWIRRLFGGWISSGLGGTRTVVVQNYTIRWIPDDRCVYYYLYNIMHTIRLCTSEFYCHSCRFLRVHKTFYIILKVVSINNYCTWRWRHMI